MECERTEKSGEAARASVVDDEPGERAHEVVDEARVRPDGLPARRALGVHGLQGIEALGENRAEEFEPESSPVLGTLGARLGTPGPAIQLGRHDGQSVTVRRKECQMTVQSSAAEVTRVRRLWRPVVEGLVPYDPGKPMETLMAELGLTELVRLSANENPLGPSPAVVEAIRREAPFVHLYPDGGATALRAALSRRLGVPPTQIVVGNGADELIAMIALAAFDPGDEIIIPTPSFEPYATSVTLAGARVRPSALAGYETDLARAELRADLQRLGLSGALLAIAAFAGFLVLVMPCFALAAG